MPKSNSVVREPSSFRDNRGFVFMDGGVVKRQINNAGQASYDSLMSSGLYEELTAAGLLLSHEDATGKLPKGAYKVITPRPVTFISYPYEWSFSQLKDAALATLEIQQRAFAKGLTLRDASAYNIQFVGGKPTLIDTLSFEPYVAGSAWQAYRQFCQHFLAPLALMSQVNVGLSSLLRDHIDGVPLQLTADLLPLKAKLRPGLAVHIVAHARVQRQQASNTSPTTRTISRTSQLGLLDNLKRTIEGLNLPKTDTEWGDYYDNTNYNDDAFSKKAALVEDFIKKVKPKRVIDLGANNGLFSRVATKHAELTISADIDPLAVEQNYLTVKKHAETKLVPLLIDLTNPSPALGWHNQERRSFTERGKSDLAMALALVHHLALSNNLPLEMIARYMSDIAPQLIIEFVPKEDSQVQKLLATREDIFPEYTQDGFERAFSTVFDVVATKPVKGSLRTLYLLKVKKS